MNVRITTYESFSRLAPLTTTNRSDCERFLQTTDNLKELKLILNRKSKFFYTFSNIFIISLTGEGRKAEKLFNEKKIQHIYENALSVYVINGGYSNSFNDKVNIKFDRVRNILTGAELNLDKADHRELANFYGHELNQPLVDVNNPRNNITASFFNCSPFVIYFEDETGNRKYVKFLGTLDK